MTEHRLNLTELARTLADGSHSIFSASGSHLWANCAGGLIPNILAPDDAGVEAAEGTVAHWVAETWQKDGVRPKRLIGTIKTVKNGRHSFDIEITHEMLRHVQRYVMRTFEVDGDKFVEQKVYYDDLTPIPKQGGTADFAAMSPGVLIIDDFKYGKGVFVDVRNNSQLMLYAYGVYREWDWWYNFKRIIIRVSQPRMDNMDEVEITVEELLEFAARMKVAAHKAWQIDAPRTPGDEQCQFCKVKGTCGAYVSYMASMMEGVYEDLTKDVQAEDVEALKDRIDLQKAFVMRPVQELTLEQLSILYQWRSSIEKWWEAVTTEIGKRVANGENAPFQKLVEGRTKRRLKRNTAFVREHLLDFIGLAAEDVIKTTFETPAGIERAMIKHGFSEESIATLLAPVVEKPPGKPTLAPLHDKRPAMQDLNADVYDDLTREIDEPEDS